MFAACVENAWIAHNTAGYDEKKRKDFHDGMMVQMRNGAVLCLLSTRPPSRIGNIAGGFLITGSVLFPSMLFYTRITDDTRFPGLQGIGGVSSLVGLFALIFS